MRHNHVIVGHGGACDFKLAGVVGVYSSNQDMADVKPGRRSPRSPRRGKKCKYAMICFLVGSYNDANGALRIIA